MRLAVALWPRILPKQSATSYLITLAAPEVRRRHHGVGFCVGAFIVIMLACAAVADQICAVTLEGRTLYSILNSRNSWFHFESSSFLARSRHHLHTNPDRSLE
ncbi:hypothetical protein CC86DRAFT_26599 [Ophiobolus disseminans]|uniref:Uncharacterized protein n=1 Tax=Ophiobolus disseminans TaxID=1469910 RepID=A0A6A6ZZ20_9PLEO|nr:hypothetical protein CC86DRAFT_26599 [Ophiobolus disseminans]